MRERAIDAELTVVRLGHRPGRDERMTTHVGLTARALGADHVVLPASAAGAVETVRDVTERFGGPFEVEAVDDPRSWLAGWTGPVIHLTMYGLPVASVLESVVEGVRGERAAVVVGGGKVGGDVFDRATWNVAVTNQPHSEVAALAVLLDRLLDGAGTPKRWRDAEARIVPSASGKRVEPTEEG
ncbi:MAG: tRNA (cytidine(56)-2'-O)-methyltransferase [Halobacteriota archaeon]